MIIAITIATAIMLLFNAGFFAWYIAAKRDRLSVILVIGWVLMLLTILVLCVVDIEACKIP